MADRIRAEHLRAALREAVERSRDCPHAEAIWDYLDGALDPAAAEALAAHIPTCCFCMSEVGRLSAAIAYRDEHRAGALESVRQRLEEAAQETPAEARAVPATPRLAVSLWRIAATLLLAAALSGGLYGCIAIIQYFSDAPLREFYKPFTGGPTTAVIGNAEVRLPDGALSRDYIGLGDARSVAA